MTDSMFEQVLDRQLREYADGGVMPFDRYAIADGLIKSGRPRRFSWLPALGRPAFSPTMAVVVIGLLLALIAAAVVGAWLVRSQLNQPPGRNGAIVFSLGDIPERPYNHLHLINPDGTGDRELAQGTAPFFSADGSTLAYFTGWGAGEPNLRLVVADEDGANAREVSPYLQSGFAYSPDGSQFAVMAGRNRTNDQSSDPLEMHSPGSIYLVSVADGIERDLVPAPEPPFRYWDMVWSPDGKYIAYSVMEEVTVADNSGMKRVAVDVVDVASGEVRRVTERLGTDGTGTAWSPDSKAIAFLGLPDGSPEPHFGSDGSTDEWWLPEDVFVVRLDGTDESNITNSEAYEGIVEWSPDGSRLAYTTSTPDGQLLAIVEMGDVSALGEPKTGPIVDEFEWSPDAQSIAYTRNIETSTANAEVQTFEGTIYTIDAALTKQPVSVATFDYIVGGLDWQWLQP